MHRPAQHRPSRVVAVLCTAFTLLVAAPAQASHVGDTLVLDQQLIAATDQLLSALAQWDKTSGGQRSAGIAQLTQLAQQRQQSMILLLQQSPGVAGARMLPRSLRAKLPAEAAAYVEQEVHVQGSALAHVSDNFSTGHSHAQFKLQGAPNTADLNIFIADPSATERDLNRMAGRKAAFDAMRVGDNLVILDKKSVQLEAAGGTGNTSGSTTTVSSTVVQGDQATLSILLNFSDKALTCTAADVASRLFGSSGATVNNNYRESSRGLVSFSGQAVGPFTISYSGSGSCDYSGWAAAGNAAAKAAGYDLTQYKRINYVTPSNSTCGWSGLAYMPGNQSWVQSCSSTGVFSHELGHNISLHHAATPTSEYGDGSDPMGGARVVDHNGANRTMAGWMPSGSVQDVGTGGSYALASVSTNAAAGSPQVLRIVKPDTSEYYFISLRQAVNLDASLSSTYLNTVAVHRATGTLPTRTYLLQNVAAGQSFLDSANGITITNQGVANGLATVAVAFGGGSCQRNAPVLSVTPSSQTAPPGAAVTYTLSVSNQNTAFCGTSDFSLTQALPAGFAGSLASTKLSIAAGASASTTWSVSAGTQISAGTYSLTASAADATVSGTPASVHATEVVYVDTTVPTVSITSPTSGATVSGNVSIAATASDDVGVQAVEIYVDGSLLTRDTSAPYSVSWNSRKSKPGLHTIKVRAVDAAGNAAEQSMTVTVK